MDLILDGPWLHALERERSAWRALQQAAAYNARLWADWRAALAVLDALRPA